MRAILVLLCALQFVVPQEEGHPLYRLPESGHLAFVEHFLFEGRPRVPFRALFISGHTWASSAISVALDLKQLGQPGSVHHVDISETWHRINNQWASNLNLDNMEFHFVESVMGLPSSLGKFDYVEWEDSLPVEMDRVAALNYLKGFLKPLGGMGIAVGGKHGSRDLLDIRSSLRALIPRERVSREEKIAVTKDIFASLPNTSQWRTVPEVANFSTVKDKEFFDLFLNQKLQNQYMSVDEIYDWMASCGLRVVTFFPEAIYEPGNILARSGTLGESLVEWLRNLSKRERYSLAEHMGSAIQHHALFAVLSDRQDQAVISLDFDRRQIPCVHQDLLLSDEDSGEMLPTDVVSLEVEVKGNDVALEMSFLSLAISKSADCQRTVEEVYQVLRQSHPDLTWQTFTEHFQKFYDAMTSVGFMTLGQQTAN